MTEGRGLIPAGEIDRMFDVGAHQIYLRCGGGPGPTVVFEAGVGEDHTNLLPIAERIRDQAYACVYDRTGVGRSSKPTPPASARTHVAELHELLRVSGVGLPAVLVGHSYGGLVAIMAAVEHPDDVAGLVLIEASHHRHLERLTVLMAEAGIPFDPASPGGAGEILDMAVTVEEASRAYGPLPDIPLTVISATKVETDAGLPPGFPGEAIKAAWLELQAEHAQLRPDARHVMAATGHYVHEEDPDLVVAEIDRMMSALRS